jgi:hypothetical protein
MQPYLAEHDSRRASLRFGYADGNPIVDKKLAYALHADLHADCERLRLGRGHPPLKLVFELRKVMHRSFYVMMTGVRRLF